MLDSFPYHRLTENRTLEEARVIFEQRRADAQEFYEKYKDAFVPRTCPVCGLNDSTPQQEFIGLYKIAKCRVCATQFVNPAPPLKALAEYYQRSESTKMSNKVLQTSRQGTPKRDEKLEATLDTIKRTLASEPSRKLSVLEIGCNSGVFLSRLLHELEKHALSERVELTGIDLDSRAIENSVSPKLNLVLANAETYLADQASKFDLIMFFELIEHLVDPFLFLSRVKHALKHGGRAIFSTPNANGLELVGLGYNSFRPLAHAIFPPMHLSAFSTENIVHFVIRAGFGVERISTPGNLDADILTVGKEDLKSPGFRALAECQPEIKGLVQQLVKELNASSHMLVEIKAR